MTPAEQLLQEIQALNGKLWPMADGSLICENVPRSFEPRLAELEDEVFLLLRFLEGLSQPDQLDKRELRKLIKTIQDAGGEFHRGPSGRFFDYIKLPEQLFAYRQLVIDNAPAIFPLVFPPVKKSFSKPRKAQCLVCAPGTGCRTTLFAYRDKFLVCPRCNHACFHHYLGLHFPQFPEDKLWNTPDGCNRFEQPDPDNPCYKVPCPCPGWPLVAPPKPRKRGKKAAPAQIELSTEEKA